MLSVNVDHLVAAGGKLIGILLCAPAARDEEDWIRSCAIQRVGAQTHSV